MKYIGIEKYFPYEVMNHSIVEFLATGGIDKSELLDTIKRYFHGENRARKAANALYSTVTKSSALQTALKNNFTAETFSSLSENDKKTIDLCFVCFRFPFAMDVVERFAKIFNVQELASGRQIFDSIASDYGANRTVDMGLNAVYYFLLDAHLVERVKPGLFKKGEKIKISNFAKEAWIFTWWALGGRKATRADELKYEPAMIFFDIDFESLADETKYFGDIFMRRA